MEHRASWRALVWLTGLGCGITSPRSQPTALAANGHGRGAPVCMTGDSLLDTSAMRDLMRLLWDHSNADAAPSERRERVGVLFDSAGTAVYRADLDNPNCTPCRSGCLVPMVGPPVAAVNTHPFRPGDLLPANCHSGDPTPRQYSVERFGGASEMDLLAFRQWDIPGYILDKDNVYAVPRGTTLDNASANVRRYPRVNRSTGCRVI